MATYVEYMRPRIRKDSFPHGEFPSWQSHESSAMPASVPVTSITGTLAHDPFHHVTDLRASHARSLFSELSSYTQGTNNSAEDFAEETSPAALIVATKNHSLGASSPQQCAPKAASSAILFATASEKGEDKTTRETIGPPVEGGGGGGRKERRQWGIGLGPQATAQTMAAVRGFGAPRAVNNGAPSGSPVDPALYQNLVDMIPLMENFLEQQSGRTMFGHRSSMIYTAAPARDMLNRKMSKNLVKAKSNVQPVSSKWGGARGEIPGREGGEHVPQKAEGRTVCRLQSEVEELKQQLWEKDVLLESLAKDSPCQTREIEDLKQQLREKDSLVEEIAYQKSQNTQQLQSELKELKQKLYDDDRVLEQAVKRSNAEIAVSKAARDRDVRELETQVEELQRELWEENRLVQAAQLELSDKEHKLEKIQCLLEGFEMDMIERDSQAGDMEAEVNELRSQVLKLRFQLDVVDNSGIMDAIQSDWAINDENNQLVSLTDHERGQEMEQVLLPLSRDMKEQKVKIDLSRRQYLAVTIAAREVPSEELLVLVGELRKQLQAFLTGPSLIDSFSANTQ